jgi:dephospho-CoA kinase
MNLNKKIIVGITGGVASGKSVVAEFFIRKDVPVINADRIGHEILRIEKIKDKLITCFGDSILKNGEIDRKKLGKIVFQDTHKLHELNAIVHPPLIKEILARIEHNAEPIIAIDAALLLQWNMNHICDYVILVTAPENIRTERLVQHTHLSYEEAKNRVHSQQEFSEQDADHVIINDGSLEELNARVEFIWEQITRNV